jgi:hypothetical protein
MWLRGRKVFEDSEYLNSNWGHLTCKANRNSYVNTGRLTSTMQFILIYRVIILSENTVR